MRPTEQPGAAVATASSADDPRVVAALESYLALRDRGEPPDRDEFLARNPEVASVLAECLDGLQLVHQAALELSSRCAGGPSAAPDRLGDYRIVRELGRGGMGVVYEAVQLSLGRRVALKVLPTASALDPRRRQRFQIEAQAAAHLHHPHIVPVFAVGCEQGASFYAMQFIEGGSLAARIRELQEDRRGGGRREPDAGSSIGERAISAPGEPREPSPSDVSSTIDEGRAARPARPTSGSAETASSTPSPRDRSFARGVARLGLQAAEALAHAHDLGVLHRDIKPANLLLDDRGDLWVTDFGLARFLDLDPDESGPTRTGDLIGTLRYMSPEQAEGGRLVVDQRADVYALGATLYEMATLRPAFGSRDRQELLRRIASDDPVAPRRIDPALPRDLETIVTKAMAKEPSGRYATARELADDLRLFLDDQPIRARRPGPLERVAKWTRRHRGVVATAAVVAAASLIVGAAMLWREQQRTKRMYDDVVRAQEEKKRLWDQTVRILDETFYPIMGIASTSGAMGDPQKREAFNNAATIYDRFAREFRDDPGHGLVAALAERRAGYFRMIMNESEPAYASYRRSIGLYEAATLRPEGGFEAREELASALQEFGLLLRHLKRDDEATACDRRGAEIVKATAAERPDRMTMRRLADVMVQGAVNLRAAGKADAASGQVRELVALAEGAARGPLSGRDRRAERIAVVEAVAGAISERGWHDEARRMVRKVLADDLDDPSAANALAWALAFPRDAGREEGAEAAALARKALEREPNNRAIWNTLGAALYRAGMWREAVEALTKSAGLPGGGDPFDCYFLAMAHRQLGEREEADRWFDKAHAWVKRRLPYGPGPDVLAIKAEAAKLLGK